MNRVLIGLGNPEPAYRTTYHNAGRLAVTYLAEEETFTYHKGAQCYVTESFYGILVLPDVAMNLSGNAVRAFLAYTSYTLEDLVVLHDDTDISLGAYKIQTNRGSGGHHGVESVFQQVGTRNVQRIRLGVRPERFRGYPANAFVLKSIAKADRPSFTSMFGELARQLAAE